MPIAIACSHCDWKGRVKDELGGKKGKCPTCGELIPIPNNPAPPPAPVARRPAVDDEPDVLDEADVVDDRPPASSRRSRSEGRGRSYDDEDERPRRRRPADDFEEDHRPSQSRRRPADDDSDERPARRRPRDEDDSDGDRPRSVRRLDSEDEDRPRPRRRTFDVDGDDEPRSRRRGRARRPEPTGPNVGMIVLGVLILIGMLGWLCGGLLLVDKIYFFPAFMIIASIVMIIRGIMGKKD